MNGGVRARFIEGSENRFVLVKGDENITDLQAELVDAAADGQGTAHEMQRPWIRGIGGEEIEIDDRRKITIGRRAQIQVRAADLKHLTLSPTAGKTVCTRVGIRWKRILVSGNPQ